MTIKHCILCGKDSGFGMVCAECREAFLVYKEGYLTKKRLKETRELDEEVFATVYDSLGVKEYVTDDVESIFPSDIESIIKEVRDYLEPKIDKTWLNAKEERYEDFWTYVANRMRKDYEEATKGNK